MATRFDYRLFAFPFPVAAQTSACVNEPVFAAFRLNAGCGALNG